MNYFNFIQKALCVGWLFIIANALNAQTLIPITAAQVSGSTSTNPEALIDDNLDTYFFAGWQNKNYPGYAYIDLGGEVTLSQIELYDFAGIDDIELYAGAPGNWQATPFLTDPLTEYQVWKTFPVNNIITTHLRIKITSPQSRISEIRIYGTFTDGPTTPVDTTTVNPPVSGTDETLCTVLSATLIHGAGIPGNLVDEQDQIGDLLNGPGGSPTNRWFAGWNMGNYPAEGYLDLGETRQLTRIFLRDINGQGNFKVYTGTPGNWNAAPIIDDNLAGYLSWTEHSTNVTTRYLKIEMQDPDSRVAELAIYGYCNDTVEPPVDEDTTPPATITNLSAATITNNTAELNWTATGDDGDMGQATAYELRYSTAPITEANFDNATLVSIDAPNQSGSFETAWVTGLNCNTTYHFALRAVDDAGNVSPLSNLFTITTAACSGNKTLVLNLSQNISNTTVNKAKLKYDKDFAYSLTLDDGGMWHYYTVYKMLEGGLSGDYPQDIPWVVFPNDPVIQEEGFAYSDGCGNYVNFKAGLAINTYRIFDFVNQFYVTWDDLDEMYDAGWDIISHSHSHCSYGCDYHDEVAINKNLLEQRLGIDATQFVIPAGDANYYQAAYDNDMLGVYTDNINLPGFEGLSVDTVMNFHEFKMHRYSLEGIAPPYDLYLNIVADNIGEGEHYWMNEFAHNIGHKHQGQYFIEVGYHDFKSYMGYLRNTFGHDHSEKKVWMAPTQEVYEYLNVRDHVQVQTTLNNDQLTIYLDDTNVPARMRRHALSLTVELPEGVSIETVVPSNVQIESYNPVTGLLNVFW